MANYSKGPTVGETWDRETDTWQIIVKMCRNNVGERTSGDKGEKGGRRETIKR